MHTIRPHLISALSLACFAIPTVTNCFCAERLLTGAPSPGYEDSLVVDEFQPGLFPLVHDGRATDVFVDSRDWTVARIAGRDMTLDIERVTGRVDYALRELLADVTQIRTAADLTRAVVKIAELGPRAFKTGGVSVSDIV